MTANRFSDIDEYGFKREEDFDYNAFGQIMSFYFTTLTNRAIKWEKYMLRHDLLSSSSTLKRYIRKGIPINFRAQVWFKTSGAYYEQKRAPDLYKKLLKLNFDKEIVDTINIDLPRTFPDNIYFQNHESQLFNILIAFAHSNKEVAYCQGLNYIAGLLLLVTKEEENSFWLLKVLIENVVPTYHTKTMSGLIRDIDVMVELLRTRCPDVINHVEQMGLPWAVIVTKWFICIFAEVLPVETVLRIWDCVFSEGIKILFRVAITIFVRNRLEILQITDISDMATYFRTLHKQIKLIDCHQFMHSIFVVPGTLRQRQIDKIRNEVSLKQNQKNKQV